MTISKRNFINELTVNETYFYRELYQFETLCNYSIPKIINTNPKKEKLRILSAPCSSGEEVYSIALYLLENCKQIHDKEIEIIGIDIDSSVLKRARKGQFSRRSISRLPLTILNKYFTEIGGDKFQIDRRIMNSVLFQNLSVFELGRRFRDAPFDVIFSRNMLIYFTESSRFRAFIELCSVMNDNAFLFLGHAEAMMKLPSILDRNRVNGSVVFAKERASVLPDSR